MTTFSFILVLALAVIVSALINQVVHGVSTPLIQIAIGVAISFFGFTASNFSLEFRAVSGTVHRAAALR